MNFSNNSLKSRTVKLHSASAAATSIAKMKQQVKYHSLRISHQYSARSGFDFVFEKHSSVIAQLTVIKKTCKMHFRRQEERK
jgi:hypothetical protein